MGREIHDSTMQLMVCLDMKIGQLKRTCDIGGSELTGLAECSHYVLMESSDRKRRFPQPWQVDQGHDCYRVLDSNGVILAVVFCRDDLRNWSAGNKHLTSDEGRRIAKAIARLPEFLMQRRGFYQRGGNSPRWKPTRPYHVAIEDSYLRAHYDEMDALCKLNAIPFNPTGERIQERGLWRVFEFAWQLDAMQFWDRFEGRWLLGDEFHYPERPKDLPLMKSLDKWPRFDPRNARR